MESKNYNIETFFGYIIATLKSFKYSEREIKVFLTEMERQMRCKTDEDALNVSKNFFDDSTKQIIIDGVEIPTKYNMCKIRDLFEEYGFIKKERPYTGDKICNNLAKYGNNIIYIKDLYEKTKKDIRAINGMGKKSYEFFIQVLSDISNNSVVEEKNDDFML